jgi:hypothetical protein
MTVEIKVRSGSDGRTVALKGDRLIVGRAEDGPEEARGRLLIADDGLEARHASINRSGARLWVLDEGSAGGTFVNNRPVPPRGLPLADGDEISLGDHTKLVVALRTTTTRQHDARAKRDDGHTPGQTGGRPSRQVVAPPKRTGGGRTKTRTRTVVVVPVLCAAALLAFGGVLLGGRATQERVTRERAVTRPPVQAEPPPAPTTQPTVETRRPTTPVENNNTSAPAPPAPGAAKRYLKMSPAEQMAFVEEQARYVSVQMGNRPYAFDDASLRLIKDYVDVYASRVGNNSRRLWGEDLRTVFARARTRYAPHIIRAFNARGVPPIVGLYLVMIETEYHNIPGENGARAAGLFQFIPKTALAYGVQPSERTNVEKMAPAAAQYMSDRITEFGTDSMSVALAIAGYNRNPDSVRRDLRDVLNSQNEERSFWTLVTNSDKLDHWFKNENVKYVPKFFAAAIVGENPEAFGLEMRKLSSYTSVQPGGDDDAPPDGDGEAAR